MSRVVVEPGELSFHADQGESVMEAANRAGVRWPNTCEGNATCGVCAYQIRCGTASIWPPTPGDEEAAGLATSPFALKGGSWRLACRTEARGDVVLVKRGVKQG